MKIKYNNFILTPYNNYDNRKYNDYHICFRRCVSIGLYSNDLYIAYYFYNKKYDTIKIFYHPSIYSDDTFMAYYADGYYINQNCKYDQIKYRNIITTIKKILFFHKKDDYDY